MLFFEFSLLAPIKFRKKQFMLMLVLRMTKSYAMVTLFPVSPLPLVCSLITDKYSEGRVENNVILEQYPTILNFTDNRVQDII